MSKSNKGLFTVFDEFAITLDCFRLDNYAQEHKKQTFEKFS